MLDEALKLVNKQRADMAAYQNRLEYAMKDLAVSAENLQTSESRICDTGALVGRITILFRADVKSLPNHHFNRSKPRIFNYTK